MTAATGNRPTAIRRASLPKGGQAVMAGRREPPKSLDFFPTPPWATRALLTHVIPHVPAHSVAWDPACGEGHMVGVLAERFEDVHASDVFDYGRGYAVGSFTGEGADVIATPTMRPPDWIITNPPFNGAVEFAVRALREARRGVALLLRTQWLEGVERYETVFRDCPPTIFAPFVERVPLHRGRWEPDGDTMTAYAWFVWERIEHALAGRTAEHPAGTLAGWNTGGARVLWIPPGCRASLTRPDDRRRFAAWSLPETDLFGEPSDSRSASRPDGVGRHS